MMTSQRRPREFQLLVSCLIPSPFVSTVTEVSYLFYSPLDRLTEIVTHIACHPSRAVLSEMYVEQETRRNGVSTVRRNELNLPRTKKKAVIYISLFDARQTEICIFRHQIEESTHSLTHSTFALNRLFSRRSLFGKL